jgi:hypothetical protein
MKTCCKVKQRSSSSSSRSSEGAYACERAETRRAAISVATPLGGALAHLAQVQHVVQHAHQVAGAVPHILQLLLPARTRRDATTRPRGARGHLHTHASTHRRIDVRMVRARASSGGEVRNCGGSRTARRHAFMQDSHRAHTSSSCSRHRRPATVPLPAGA